MENKDSELVKSGIEHMRTGTFDLAEQFFNDAIALEGPYLHKAYYNKGVLCHEHLNKMQEALNCYEKATSLKPDYGKAWTNLGEVLCHFHQYGEAKTVYLKALELMPEETLPLIGLAYALNRINDFSNSIDILTELLDEEGIIDEFLAKINSELGLALLQTNQAKKAHVHFKKAFELDEKDYQACYNIAFIEDAFKNYEEAHTFYDKAIALNTNEGKAYQGKACTFIHTKKYPEALDFITKAIDLSPENFEGYYNLACICSGMGKEPELLDAIEKTIRLAPVQIGIATHIMNDPDFLPYSKQQNFMDVLEKKR